MLVTGANTDSVAVVNVTTKTAPVVRGVVVSATYMDYAYGVPDGNYVFVTGLCTDSVDDANSPGKGTASAARSARTAAPATTTKMTTTTTTTTLVVPQLLPLFLLRTPV